MEQCWVFKPRPCSLALLLNIDLRPRKVDFLCWITEKIIFVLLAEACLSSPFLSLPCALRVTKGQDVRVSWRVPRGTSPLAARIRDLRNFQHTEQSVEDCSPWQGHCLCNAHPSAARIYQRQKAQTNAAAGWLDLIFSRECYYCVF